jgi:xylulose-5-phosphate/fructose-6-phosphate phosphoketolase
MTWSERPSGLADRDFDTLFTVDDDHLRPQGYPWFIDRLIYRRPATAAFACAATRKKERRPRRSTWPINELDRFLLVGEVSDCMPKLGERAVFAKQGHPRPARRY